MSTIIDLDQLTAVPELSLGDALRYAPVVAAIAAAVEQALRTGAFEAPAIHFRAGGRAVTLGPFPVTVT